MQDWLVLRGSFKKLNKNSTHRFGITRLTSSGSSNIVESGLIIYNKCNLKFLSNCFNDKIIKSFSSSLCILLRVCLQDDDPTLGTYMLKSFSSLFMHTHWSPTGASYSAVAVYDHV